MKKALIASLLVLGSFTFYACHPYVSHPSTGAFGLDPGHSSLQVTVMKNESIPVILKFPKLSGSLSFNPTMASVSAGIDTLDSGNPIRDKNVTTLFFEVAQPSIKRAL